MHIVGSHEDGTQQQTAGQHVAQGVNSVEGHEEIACEHSGDEGHGHIPLDHLADNQVAVAQQQCDGAGLTDGATVSADQQLQQSGSLGGTGNAFVQVGQGSGAGSDLGNSIAQELQVKQGSDRSTAIGVRGCSAPIIDFETIPNS